MNFLTPLALVFAASLPVVVVFYLLKRKRVVRLVPSTVLWQKFLAENQASAPFQKLRRNWLLLLQLLLLAFVVLALARPYFSGRTAEAMLQVVILDASASMQASDVSPSRFERARSEALSLVDSMKTGVRGQSQQMLLLVAGAAAEVRQSATSEKSALRRAIQGAEVTDSSTRLTEALRVAETLTRDKPGAEIHLFSDGAGVDLSEFESKDLRLVYHPVGVRSRNLGIVSMDVKPNPEDPRQRAVFASVANASGEPLETTLELLFDGQLIESKSISVGATNLVPVVFSAPQARQGVFTVRLGIRDDLAADNQASVASALPEPVRVVLVSRGNRFLERALSAAGPNVEVSLASDLNAPLPRADVFVLDDVAPTVWPTGNVLAIHVGNTNWFPGGISEIEAPPIVDWRNTHPLLRFVGLDTVQVASSLAVKTPQWAVSLVDSPSAPLVLAGEFGRQRMVWIGFDTLQSTWPLRVSFPIFIANAMEWLNPVTARSELFQIHAGDAFRMPLGDLAAAVTEAQVTAPGNRQRTVSLGANARELVFGETSRQGVYQVQVGTNHVEFCANLLDARESNLTPQKELSLGRGGTVAGTRTLRANLEYWREFALLALAVLMAEWWWFHRRTA